MLCVLQVIKSVKQFFGPVVETLPSPEPEAPQSARQAEVEADDIPRISFRLTGMPPKLLLFCILLYKFSYALCIEAPQSARQAEGEADDIPRISFRLTSMPPKLLHMLQISLKTTTYVTENHCKSH